MRLLSFSRASTPIVLADVGGGGAAVGLMEQAASGASKLAAVERVAVSLDERQEAHSIASVTQALAESTKKLVEALAKSGRPIQPKELYITVHAPWAASSTATAVQVFEKEERITDAMIGELAKKALAGAKGSDSASLIEGSVSHIELNGYPTRKPGGRSATSLRVVVLVSEMEKQYRDAIESVLKPAFPGASIKFRSHVRALASLLQNSDDSRNCVIIDVADDGTSISVLRKQVLAEQARISAGIHALLAKAAPTGLREETLALLSMLERGTCSSGECERITQTLSAAEPELTKVYGEALGSLAAKRRLPNQAFLLTHQDVAPWFSRFLARIDFAQFTLTSLPFDIHVLSPEGFSGYVRPVPGVSNDLSLLITAALVHNEKRSGE